MAEQSVGEVQGGGATGKFKVGGWYAHYVLGVLVIVYIFNFIDRQILSVLAEDIKRDLGVTDAQMGFLYGTVFAVFYAVFGIPLARFADVWVRRSLISIGLFFWSLMTALSATARSFPMLATYRVGVGVGEASASPAAFSMLSDYYSPKLRGTVLAIYSSGVYIGNGIGLFLGGYVMETWNSTFPDPVTAPLNLKGWQAAFLAVGVPGLLMALWMRSLREPPRGVSEGITSKQHPAPLSVLAAELAAILPVFNLVVLKRDGASLAVNLGAAAVIALVAWAVTVTVGNAAQWIALGIGLYVTFSWAQSLKARDPVAFHMIFKTKSMLYVMAAFPFLAFVGYGVGFWTVPLMLRLHETTATEVGLYIGLGSAIGGLLGVTLGGMLSDKLKTRMANGRLVIGYISVIGTVPLVLWMIYTPSLTVAFALNFSHHLFSACWPGTAATTATELVLPRMRAISTACYILMITMIGLAMGPFFMGQMSDMFMEGGMDSAESLRAAIAYSMLFFVVALVFLTLAWRHLPKDEASRVERARALGEELTEV